MQTVFIIIIIAILLILGMWFTGFFFRLKVVARVEGDHLIAGLDHLDP
jgi:hypothetical protein